MRHAELQLGTLDRLPESDVHLVLEIAARLLLEFLLDASAAAKHRRENIFESAATPSGSTTGRAGALGEIIEIEPPEVERNLLSAASSPILRGAATSAGISLRRRRINVVGVETKLIVDLALLGLAENVIRLGERLELLLRGLVARVHVGMVFARKFAERLADLLRRSRLLHPENRVIVFLVRGCHSVVYVASPSGRGGTANQ